LATRSRKNTLVELSVAIPVRTMIPARPPALVSWENSSANNAYVFTSPAPLSGNRCLAYKHAGSFGRAFRHYGDSAQNIPSSGSGEPSAAHFPESSPPSPCGLRLDSLRSLRWEFVARACPAGAREATLGSKRPPRLFRAQNRYGKNPGGFGESNQRITKSSHS